MITNQIIKEIVTAGVQAPSGSNSQPWKFSVKDGVVTVYALFEKDHPILNYRNRGTLLAHGALLENIDIAAREYGYVANIKILETEGNDVVSEIAFMEKEKEAQPLYSAIFRRSINRKPYKKAALSEKEKQEFVTAIKDVNDVSVVLIEEREKIKQLAKATSMSELLIFENEALHELLFEEIVWTIEEENRKKEGLFLKTMELNAPQRFLLRFLKHWPVTKMANSVGFSKLLAKGNADIYASTPIMGMIQVPDDDKSFIEAGRVMEQLWLKATEMGLSFHILTGMSFLWQQIVLGGGEGFTEKHAKLVRDTYAIIKAIGNVSEDKIPVVVFRVGYGKAPSARSSKKEPDIVFE